MHNALLKLIITAIVVIPMSSVEAMPHRFFNGQAILSVPKSMKADVTAMRYSSLSNGSFRSLDASRLNNRMSLAVSPRRQNSNKDENLTFYSNRRNPCRAPNIRRFLRVAKGVICEPNWEVKLTTTPNDTLYSSMYNAGSSAAGRIYLPEAWSIATGSSSTVVGVIDTGADYGHLDLSSNMWTSPGEISGNAIDDDGNGYIDDVHGYDFYNGDGNPMDDHSHGTAVSGTIGAIGNNSRGVVGVNWAITIVPCKAFGSSGTGSLSAILQCLYYLVDLKQEYSLNMIATNNSYGGFPYSSAFIDAITVTKDAGMVFVAGAGNNTSDNDSSPFYPASYNLDNIISVAATDSAGVLTSISNYGATSVDIAAPGTGVLTTILSNQYGYYQGTSIAAPHVTGAIALIRTYQSSYTYQQAIEAVLHSGTVFSGLSSKCSTSSILNVGAALQYTIATPIPTTTATPAPSATSTPNPSATVSPTPSSEEPTDFSTGKLAISSSSAKSSIAVYCDLSARKGTSYQALSGYRVYLNSGSFNRKAATTNSSGRAKFTLRPASRRSFSARCTASLKASGSSTTYAVRSRLVNLKLKT